VVKTNEHIVEQTKQKNTLSVERLEHIGRTVRTHCRTGRSKEHIVGRAVRTNEHMVERSEQNNTFQNRQNKRTHYWYSGQNKRTHLRTD